MKTLYKFAFQGPRGLATAETCCAFLRNDESEELENYRWQLVHGVEQLKLFRIMVGWQSDIDIHEWVTSRCLQNKREQLELFE